MRPRRFRGEGGTDPAARRTVVDEGAPTVVEEEYVPPRRPRPPLLWPWLLLLLLLVAGGLAAAYFLTHDNDKKKSTSTTAAAVTVPNVVGMKQAQAQNVLSDQGLQSQVLTRASKSPKGTVFQQTPAAGVTVAHGAPVQLSVSAVAITKVPKVVGLKTAAAVRKLKAAGLGAQVVSVAGAKPAGTVLAQTPGAAKTVGKGSTVALKVSKGTAAVPDVVGQQASDAKAALGTAGFKTSIFEVPNAQKKGTVVAEHPSAGTKAPRGSKVRINVSNGSQATSPGTTTTGTTTSSATTTSAPATVKVPKVVGLQQGPAQRRLNRAGLRSRVVYVASQSPAGQVVSQTPIAGSSVKRGSRVRIRVSLGPNQPATTVVPDVIGNDQQSATTKLQNASFTVQVIQVPVTDPSQVGTVVDEEPGGGSRAPTGSQVTIYVGQSG
jgi:serine/threonine-protein kinase